MDTRDRVVTDVRDRSVADAHSKSTMANVVGWLALILSIIALALAWTAYNNASEENLGDMIQDKMQGLVQTGEQQQDRLNDTFDGDITTPSTDSTMNEDTTVPQEDATTPQTTN